MGMRIEEDDDDLAVEYAVSSGWMPLDLVLDRCQLPERGLET